ncbi:hypothetical protein ACBQ19_17805, partial [Hafnia alvei]
MKTGELSLNPRSKHRQIQSFPSFNHRIGKAGSRLGTALAMAVDNEIGMVPLVRNLEEFFARESCGWCT